MPDRPVVLTIAGSDSGGGAGIQADLRTFEALGVFGTTALTCVTAQNPAGVGGVAALEPAFVVRQIEAVRQGFPVAAAKTGMLYSASVIRAVAGHLAGRPVPVLVVDPVMVATSGARLLRRDAVRALCRDLLPLASVITPNLPEAEQLLDRRIPSVAALRAAARELGRRYGTACVVKGGHLGSRARQVNDVLYAEGTLHTFEAPRVRAAQTHGTGCTFSAALAGGLAAGRALPEAVRAAQQLVGRALRRAGPVGDHRPLDLRGRCAAAAELS